MSIKKIIEFKGTMTVKSGVHIGGTNEGTKVGGCDNPVIRNPLTNDPYIPGSSIKGVLRSTAEKMPAYAYKIRDGKPCGCGQRDCIVCKLFGAHMNKKPESGEPRLIIRDMNMNRDFLDNLFTSGGNRSDLTEIKTSTMIDRRTNMAYTGDDSNSNDNKKDNKKDSKKGGSLRSMERVVAGVVFDCYFTLKIMDKDNEEELINFFKKCISIVEATGIGGKVTSGSGQVEFDIDWNNPNVINM